MVGFVKKTFFFSMKTILSMCQKTRIVPLQHNVYLLIEYEKNIISLKLFLDKLSSKNAVEISWIL